MYTSVKFAALTRGSRLMIECASEAVMHSKYNMDVMFHWISLCAILVVIGVA